MVEKRNPGDPHTYSNPEQCAITHMDLNLEIDFSKTILKGFVDLSVERKDNKANLILDTSDLTIHSIHNQNNFNKMSFELGKRNEKFGTKLEIKIPKRGIKGDLIVRIEYETSPKANALQWLEPRQTAGKEHPYVFSQCQPISARSIVPCQDSPGVKMTYTATVKAPKEIIVLMSALREGTTDDGEFTVYKFKQEVPIPSYLLSIAAGALESRQIGPRSHVWSEKEMVDKAADEFSDAEKMLSIAEELAGDYVWGIYDLLVLPPSFAFGGMENPCVTFLTPTILAGDKSLVDVIAHEICHSWTGNLVTNRNYEHFWINEGFTQFLERKVIGRMHTESHRHFSAVSGWKDLEYTINTSEPDYTKLVPDLTDIHPDDVYSSVPYEKGHTLLFYLEQLLGGTEVFEKFLKSYIQEFQKQSIDTDTWKSYLYKYFSDKEDILNSVDWDAWLYGTGMPPVKPDFDYTLGEKCSVLANSWLKAEEDDLTQFAYADIEKFTSPQIQEFIALLLEEPPLPIKKLEKMAEVYKLNEKMNSEIRFRWIQLGLRAHWKEAVPNALKFVNEQGRMKFVRPIYRDLYDWDEVRDEAISNFKAHESEMMYVSAYTLRKDMGLEEESEE